jgi:hypothetical protein
VAKLLDRLARYCGGLAIPNLTLILLAGQIACYGLFLARPELLEKLVLVPQLVLQGEVWRLLTFLAVPPAINPICLLFGWYLFFLMGTALEGQWGTFRYNVYLGIGWLATIAAAFAFPDQPATNAFLAGTVFLAFAQLYPRFELSLFFVLPVQVRYLALLTWIWYGLTALGGAWAVRLTILAAVLNFLLFFADDILLHMRTSRRRMEWHRRQIAARPATVHRCAVCGLTEQIDPKMDFRYCSKCAGSYEYCQEHLRNHEHVAAEEAEPAS